MMKPFDNGSTVKNTRGPTKIVKIALISVNLRLSGSRCELKLKKRLNVRLVIEITTPRKTLRFTHRIGVTLKWT